MPNNEEKVPADGTPASATDTSNKATEQSEFTETVLNLVVAVFFYSILAYAFMFMSHLNPKFEWLIVIVGATVVAFLYIPLSKDSRYVYKVLGPYIVVLLILFAAAMVNVPFAPSDPLHVFKELVVIYFSFLPAWLYLQFLATKGKTIWDEYVLALFRLQIDDFAHLPRPPADSHFFKEWETAREKHPELKKLREPNTYQKKFEARFGPVGGKLLPDSVAISVSIRSENLWPVAMATLLIAVGWAMVAMLPSHAGDVPLDPIRYGFLGSYFYILQMLVRRYFHNDLKTDAYVQATMRIIVVSLLIWALESVYGKSSAAGASVPDGWLATAFLIGVFPHIGLQALLTLVKLPIKYFVTTLNPKYPPSELDGLNIWYESRLLEEGVEDMENLATANLVDVLLNTRIPVERLIDWIDQSLLYLHLPPNSSKDVNASREKLRLFGIRTATDLEDLFKSGESVLIEKVQHAFDESPHADGALQAIFTVMPREPNLNHVRSWKNFQWETPASGSREVGKSPISGPKTLPVESDSEVVEASR